MRLRTIAAAGLGTAALVLAALPAATASTPSGTAGVTSHLAGTSSSHGATGSKVSMKKGKCGSKFGTELPTVDGVISWNDGSGAYDDAGAADVKCKKATQIKKVSVYGYFGAATETFNVTAYGNSATNEPDDSNVICSSQATGAAGGQYPTHALTVLKFKCMLPKGVSWISVQNADGAGPWYWEMQNEQNKNAPDWIDRPNSFGSGCTTYSNSRYLVDCLGYTYGDWMMVLN